MTKHHLSQQNFAPPGLQPSVAASKILGIDLGTSNTCFGYFDKNHIELKQDVEGKCLIPSGVLFTDEGDILVGSLAED